MRAVSQLPPTETAAGLSVWENMRGLFDYLDDFYSDCMLMDMSIKTLLQPDSVWVSAYRAMSFQRLAARDGAMSLYHIGVALEHVRGQTATCKTWRELADTDALKEIEKDFKAKFPHFVRMRHAIGHQAELRKSPKKIEQHFSGEPIQKWANVSGTKFEMTRDGEILTVDVGNATLNFLVSLMERLLNAYSVVVETEKP